MDRLGHATLLWLGLAALGPATAAAQQRPQPPPDERPADRPTDPADPMADARRRYTSLFGGATEEREQPGGLRFDGTLYGAWDENLLAEFTSPTTTSALQVSGAYTNLIGDLRYVRNTNRLQVAATGGASARYYTSLNQFAANDFHGGGGASLRLDRVTTLGLNQTLSYAPVYLFGLFADALPPPLGSVQTPDSAYAVNDDRAVTSDTRAEIERRLSVRSLVSAQAAYRRSHFTVVTPRGTDFASIDAGGDYRYRLTENSDLRLGYFYRDANYIGAEPFGGLVTRPVEHNLHAGVAFHPSLSEERRTIVTFEGGTSFVSSALANNAFEPRRQVRLVGDAAVAHQMGRTWLVVGALKRGTGFVQGLNGPVFTDAVSVTTTGFFNPRTDLFASVGYSNGEPTLAGAVQTFSTLTADARLRVALNSRWAITGQYVFYHYDFSKVLDLAAGLEPTIKRNTLRIGVSVWWPLR
ncbi:MAG: hypothetical protein R2708_25335 [Vicinamibacterales bacterium]